MFDEIIYKIILENSEVDLIDANEKQKYTDILKEIAENGPEGISRIHKETGFPNQEIRDALRDFEECNIITPTSKGAEITDHIVDELSEYNDTIGDESEEQPELMESLDSDLIHDLQVVIKNSNNNSINWSDVQNKIGGDSWGRLIEEGLLVGSEDGFKINIPGILQSIVRERASNDDSDASNKYGRDNATTRTKKLLIDTHESRKSDTEADLNDNFKQTETDHPDTIPKAPKVEMHLDDFVENQPIGQGGNADVIEGTVEKSGVKKQIAIKKPRMSGTIKSETMKEMLNEAEVWQGLDGHDHIVGVVDWGREPVPWIGMEYMDGGHIRERISDMGFAQKLWSAISITKAVRHAHRHGVVHLDIKPENILFRSVEDAWDVPKVADWGLSKRLLENSQSVEGMSPLYAAPEQFNDEYGSTDHDTDIYQLGAVFYELFTNKPPFEGKPSKVMFKHLQEDPTPPTDLADIPEQLSEILLKSLSKAKEDRYDDTILLRNALQDLYSGL